MSAQISASNIVDYAEALTGLIDHETGLLDSNAPERLIETQEQKQALIEDYRAGVNLIRTGKLALTDPEREQLSVAGLKLEERMGHHARRVARLKSITEGLIHTIAEHADKRSLPVDSYGAHGRMKASGAARNAYRKPTALSVNRMI